MSESDHSDDQMADELGPRDHAREACGRAEEAAFLAEHILETDPRWTRAQQMQLVADIIDQSADHALRCEQQLEDQSVDTDDEAFEEGQ